eukprot:scaffold9124_cov101-Isochrysis_galbana.AAC.10
MAGSIPGPRERAADDPATPHAGPAGRHAPRALSAGSSPAASVSMAGLESELTHHDLTRGRQGGVWSAASGWEVGRGDPSGRRAAYPANGTG